MNCIWLFVSDCVTVNSVSSPSGKSWFHLMRVPAIWPENEQTVKQRLDVGYIITTLGEDLQQTSMNLDKQIKTK